MAEALRNGGTQLKRLLLDRPPPTSLLQWMVRLALRLTI